jgi:Predicted dehydrogenases and related proteins
MRIGMIGAGGIAAKLALTIAQMEGVTNYAIASRDLNRAEAFKQQYHFEKAYGSYESLMQDPEVDLVYIATPHSEHYRQMALALAYHKPVLCEKAFTANAKEAQDIIKKFEAKGVFLTEAIWTRYLPSRALINDLLKSDIIGKPYLVSANLCYPNKSHARLNDPHLAGGALLDMGIYPLTFALMIYQENPVAITAECHKSETGVDEATTMILHFKEGQQAILFTSMLGPSDRNGYVYGSKGYLEIINCNNPERLNVYDASHTLLKSVPIVEEINGYEYEIKECARCLKEHVIESPFIPHETTIKVMAIMDKMRRQMGIVYPFELDDKLN